MMADRRDVVVGLFRDPSEARDAIHALKDAGFSGDDISLLMPDRDATRDLADETGTQAATGAATGAVAGGILGGLGGWLFGVGALAIPVAGPFIAAGAFATALTGAAIGAGVGAIAGALVGMGIPEDEAEWYEGEVRGGRTLVTVHAGGRYDETYNLLRRHGAYDIQSREPVGARGETSGYGAVTAEPPLGYQPNASLGASYGTSYGTSAGTSTLGRWEDDMWFYRGGWEQRFGARGGRWEDDEPSYRYGWEQSSNPRYSGRQWGDVESDFRRDWETRYPDQPWDRAGEAIRDAWEHRPRG